MDHKQKVFIFTTAYHPFVGGAEIAIQEITRRLASRFDFYIITSRFRRDLPRREIREEGTIIRLGFGNRFDKWLLPLLALFFYRDRISVDERHIFFGVDISQGTFAAAFLNFFYRRIPFIVNIQYGYGDERLASGRLGAIGFSFRWILSRADYVTAISSYLLNVARTYGYKGPGEVIHNGVDMGKFASCKLPTENHQSNIVITTSRLVQKNAVDTLITAIAQAKKKIHDIELHIVGDGPERKNLEAHVAKYKLQDAVRFFGSIPYEKIPEYLHAADIFVRPSRSEGMGNSFVEALAAGIPIIGTPVGGIVDIIKDGITGLFSAVDDPNDLSEKMCRLLMDQNLRSTIVTNGKKLIQEKFSWNFIASVYSRVFEDARAHVRLLIATPLMPPQLGGPAQYVHHLSKEFLRLGHAVKVVSFGKYLKFPSGVRHLLYFAELAGSILKSDLLFALDYTSVGFPAAIVSMVFRKHIVIRVEGDFLWESFVERTRQDMTLNEFYKNPPRLNAKEMLIKRLSGWILRHADKLVFSSEWRRQMVINAYKIPFEKTGIIRNAFPFAGLTQHRTRDNVILWAGRMLYLKNLQRLITAFAAINISSYELHLVGEGPERKYLEQLVREHHAESRIKFFPSISHQELMDKLASVTAIVVPSLSDVGPTIVAEAIGAGIPVIMTRESGYTEIFNDTVELVDPLNETELRMKLEKFMSMLAERITPPRDYIREWAVTAKDWSILFDAL